MRTIAARKIIYLCGVGYYFNLSSEWHSFQRRVLGCAPSPMTHLLNKECGFPRLHSHHSFNPISLLIMRVNFYFLAFKHHFFFFYLPLVTNRGVSSHWFLWLIETENQRLSLSDGDGYVVILTLKQAGILVERIMFTHLLWSAFSLTILASVRVRWEDQGFQVSLRSGNTHCNPVVSKGLCALNPCVYI